jgi:hypothetical protein
VEGPLLRVARAKELFPRSFKLRWASSWMEDETRVEEDFALLRSQVVKLQVATFTRIQPR